MQKGSIEKQLAVEDWDLPNSGLSNHHYFFVDSNFLQKGLHQYCVDQRSCHQELFLLKYKHKINPEQ